MKYIIKHKEGKLISQTANQFVIEAGSENIFQVVEILDNNEIPTKNITWTVIYDQVLDIRPNKDQLAINISAKDSGLIIFNLIAYVNDIDENLKQIGEATVKGYCTPVVTECTIPQTVQEYGTGINIAFEVEGLNENRLTLEIWDKGNIIYASTKKKCIEGIIDYFISGVETIRWNSLNQQEEENFVIKLKTDGGYIVSTIGSTDIGELTFIGRQATADFEFPENKSMATISDNSEDVPNYTAEEGFRVVMVKNVVDESNLPEKEESDLWKSNLFVEVCTEVEFIAKNAKGEELNEEVRWTVIVDDEQECELNSLDIITKYSNTLTGSKVLLVIPKEWGQKTIKLIATLESDDEKIIQGDILIKDHIVAAFYRINPDNPIDKDIIVNVEAGGTYNILGLPFHHHQGIYKENGYFYISGSTGWVPSYVYTNATEVGDNNISKPQKINNKCPLLLDKGVLQYYKHPGGVQVSGGILAVGLEQYWPILAVTTGTNSLVCFYDLESGDEIADIRIVLDETYDWKIKRLEEETGTIVDELKGKENLIGVGDKASAVGIVYRRNAKDWIVANRGADNIVQFYRIKKEDSNKYSIDKIGDKIPNVGDFQNVNLFIDDKEQVYMFGMGNEKGEGVWDPPLYHVTELDERGYLKDSCWVQQDDELFPFLEDLKLKGDDEIRKFKYQILPLDYENKLLSGWNDDVEEDTFDTYHKIESMNTLLVKRVETYTMTDSVCRIFHVADIDSKIRVESVSINDKGFLEYGDYRNTEKNAVAFDCKSGSKPRFHWASCLYLDTLDQNKKDGFKGHLTLYAIGQKVENNNIIPCISFTEN